MNGGDHQPAQPGMPRSWPQANADAGALRLPPDVARRVPGRRHRPTACPRWAGELRSGARANLLMGVLSNRVDIKIAAAVAERELERLAEPLAALWLPAERVAGRACSTRPGWR